MQTYTPTQLSLRNGQDREEIWVAVNGLIYDLGSSRMRRKGRHYEHWAGQELAGELADAPHLPDVLKKFPIIGRLGEPVK